MGGREGGTNLYFRRANAALILGVVYSKKKRVIERSRGMDIGL